MFSLSSTLPAPFLLLLLLLLLPHALASALRFLYGIVQFVGVLILYYYLLELAPMQYLYADLFVVVRVMIGLIIYTLSSTHMATSEYSLCAHLLAAVRTQSGGSIEMTYLPDTLFLYIAPLDQATVPMCPPLWPPCCLSMSISRLSLVGTAA
jgi:hypothetical protein